MALNKVAKKQKKIQKTKLEIFSTQSFSTMPVCFKIFSLNVDDQLYGCQVTVNSIDSFDMVARKGLWYPSVVCVLIDLYLLTNIITRVDLSR